MGEIHICTKCKHFREKAIANPYCSIFDVWTPEILEAKTKWDQEQNEIAIVEQQRFEVGEPFDYEPNYYPWCSAWTEKDAQKVIDPVTGAQTPIFVICARANADGRCKLYEQKK